MGSGDSLVCHDSCSVQPGHLWGERISDLAIDRQSGPLKSIWRAVTRAKSSLASVTYCSSEEKLCSHPQDVGAVVFGQSCSRLGVIVVVNSSFEFDARDLRRSFQNFKSRSVEEINTSAPKHCHISKKTIIIASPSKASLKGAPKCPIILIQYQPEIDALSGSLVNDVLFRNVTISAQL